MLYANFVAILFLLVSFIIPQFKPSSIGYLALLGLGFPVILLINILFITFWLFRRPRFIILSGLAILIGLPVVTDFFRFSLGEDAVDEEDDLIEVMTFNAHLFGVYDKENSTEKRDEIFEILKGESPDIICFQEFFHSDRKGYFTTKDSLLKFLPTKYYHERYTHAVNGRNYFGVALFSKYKIINKGFIPFESDVNNFCIYADVVIKKDTVRVYNAHLQSIRFKPEDYAFVEDNKNQEELKTGITRIAQRLKIAFQKRQTQVEKVAESIKICRYPVILCGDFNDTPVSYTYDTFSDLLKDSFSEQGSGIGNTYNGAFPSFRIDYIFHSDTLQTDYYRTIKEDVSDHYPVVAGMHFKQP